MKKVVLFIMAAFFVCALSSCGSSGYTSSYGSYSSSSSTDAYSKPTQQGSTECAACGGRGWITRNGQRETCGACGGTGKAVSFPEPKK